MRELALKSGDSFVTKCNGEDKLLLHFVVLPSAQTKGEARILRLIHGKMVNKSK